MKKSVFPKKQDPIDDDAEIAYPEDESPVDVPEMDDDEVMSIDDEDNLSDDDVDDEW